MVYIHSWQEFQDAAEVLYEQNPNKTRYCIKWKSSEGKLVLKITNDTTCLKFKTFSSIFLNRFEALNLALIEKMQNRPVDVVAATPSKISTPTPGGDRSSNPAASSAVAQASGPKTGGVKKKKGKRK